MTFMVTWLWQGLAIAWITAAAVWTMPRLNAATRHAVWWLALAAVLAIPVAHALAALTTSAPPAPDLTPPRGAGIGGALILPAIPAGVVACAAALWAMTAAAGLLRIAGSYRALGRLKRASARFDPSREARLPLWVAAREGGHHRAAGLRVSGTMTGACALGLGRPVILVSRSVADALSDESLDEIVMHEQAHLDRYDDWSQLLLSVVGSVAGLHPAVRFLARRLDVDCEAACDDRVVSCTGAARRYASSLLTVAAASNSGPRGVEFAGGALTATASALRVRVGRLLDPRRDRGARLASATSRVSMTALGLAVIISTQVAPVVIFVETAGNTPGVPAAAAPAIDMRPAPEPSLPRNVTATAVGLARPLRRALTHSTLSTQSDPPDMAAQSSVRTTQDDAPTVLIDSHVIAAVANAPVLVVPVPSSQPAAIPSAPIPARGPWEAVSDSATSAASDLTRAATETGARARSTGVSIGRFFTRAGRAGTSIF